MDFPFYTHPIPYLTKQQMVEVDRVMVEDYQIELTQMMENAGRNLAHMARVRFLGGDPRAKRVVVLAGSGGNGGGALVCARRLHNWGAQVIILITRHDAEFTPTPAHQLGILRHMGVQVEPAESLERASDSELVIDGVIGYSLQGAPRDSAATLIRWANAQPAPILALDIPSGLDATSGAAHNPTIRATATMTLALPKEGLRARGAQAYTGELYLADISVPPGLYSGPSLSLQVGPIFAENEIIRLI